MKKVLAYILIFLLITNPLWATTYYVSTTDGSDAYNGLYQTFQSGSDGPWLTKAKVNTDVSGSGDDVYFNRGNTWIDSTQLTVDWSGTSGDHVIIGAYGTGDRPRIENNSGTITLELEDSSNDYIDLVNLDLRSGTVYVLRAQVVDHILIDNCHLTQTNNEGHVTRFQTCTYLEIKDSVITWDATIGALSNDKECVYLNPVDYAYIHNNIIEGATHDNINVADGSDYVYIYENEIRAPDRGFNHGVGLHGTYNFVYRNYIHHTRGASQSSDGHHHYIYNNVFIHNYNCCAGTGAGYGDCPENYETTAGNCNDGATQVQRGGGWGIQEDVSNVYILNNYFGDIAEWGIKYYGSTMTPDTFEVKNNIFDDCGMANKQTDEPPGSGIDWQDYTIVVNQNFDNIEQTWDIRNNLFYPVTKDRDPPADDIYYKPADNVDSADRLWQIPTNGGDTEFNYCDTSVPFVNLTSSGNFTANPDVGTYGTLNAGSPAIDAGLTLTTIPNVIADGDIDDAIDYSTTDFSDFVNTVSITVQTVPWNLGPFGNNETAGKTVDTGGAQSITMGGSQTLTLQ